MAGVSKEERITDILKRAKVANVVSAVVVVVAAVYAAYSGNIELLKALAFMSAGYLFGTVRRNG